MHRHLPHYKKSLIPNARRLRRQMTDAEGKLWSLLRGRRLEAKFRRQVPFDKYVLDFYCVKEKLCIELDGSQHSTEEGSRQDRERDKYLREHGVRVLRFSDVDMLKNPEGVLGAIWEALRHPIR